MRLPIESARKTAFGEKMQSATEKEFLQALRSVPWHRKEHIDGGKRSMDVEYKDRGTLIAKKTLIYSRGKVSQVYYMVNPDYLPGGSMARQAKKNLPEELKKHQFTSDDNPNPKGNDKDGDGETGEKKPFETKGKGKKALLPIERAMLASSEKVAEVRPGQKFVIVDVSVPGGKWVDGIIYDGTRKADREAEKMMRQGKRVQVIDAVWFAPAEAKLRALGMRAASEQQAEKLEAEAEANEAQADADRQKADAARMKESADLLPIERAAKKKLPDELKKHQFTSDDNPNPKGSDKDGDGESGEKPDFLKEIEGKKGKKSAGRNPFPELGRSVFPGQAVQAVFPGPYDRRTKDVMGDTSPLGYWAIMFGDENGWFRYSDIAILAGEDGESIDMVHRKDGKWYWGASVDLEPWRTASLSKMRGKKASLRMAARLHFAGRRYDYDEVIDFLTDDKSTPDLERKWKKWSEMVEDLHDRWFEGWAEANAPELLDESIDYKELAWKAFGSVTGMGIGLWEGDFLGDEHDEAFEKVVERDSKVSRFGQDLDDEISMAREGDDEESMRMASEQMIRKAFVPDSVNGWLEWEDGSRTAAAPIDDLFEMRDVRYPPEVGFIVDLLVNLGFGEGYGSPDAVLRWVEAGKSVPETIADITKHWRKQFKSTNPKVQAAFLKAMASIEDNAAPAKEYPPPRRRRA